jgi:hypothetical protein
MVKLNTDSSSLVRPAWLLDGPTCPSPGPILLMQAITALKAEMNRMKPSRAYNYA